MEARAKPISEILFSQDQYLIPFFQRSYSWTVKQWARLVDDIEGLLADPTRHQHFLGPLVCTPGKHLPGEVNPYQLIDGQQRLTTLTLLLIALRDVSSERQHKELADEIEEDLLVHKRRNGLQRYKIVPRLGDRELLIALVDRKDLPGPKDAGVVKAYRYFRKWIEKLNAGDQHLLRSLLTTVRDRLPLVMITITGENPYEIFESLNSTGLPPEESDLIRNYLFMQVTPLEHQDEFNRDYWVPSESVLQAEVRGRLLSPTGFYRDYLMRRGKYSKKRFTFVDFKEQNRTRGLSPVDRVAELRRFLRHARLIEGLESSGNAAIDLSLESLHGLDVSTANSLLMNLLDRWQFESLTPADFLGCLRDLASFVLRRTVCNLSTRGYGQWFVDAIDVVDGKHGSPRGNLQQFYLSKGRPSDQRFTAALLSFDLYKREPAKARLILESLEDSYGHKERVDKGTLTLEHVLPQKPNVAAEAEWRVTLGNGGSNWYPVHQKWVHTIGNLTLTGYNGELSNRPFSSKRQALLQSNLVLNQYFEDFSQWGPAEIEQRARALVHQVAVLWPNPVQLQDDDPEPIAEPGTAFDIDGLREASVAKVAKHLSVDLVVDGEARFTADSRKLRVLCIASQPYQEGRVTTYWFGVTPEQLRFLRAAEQSHVALCCGSPDRILLIRLAEFEPLTAHMNVTENKHWHVQISWGDVILLDQPKAQTTKRDVTNYLLK